MIWLFWTSLGCLLAPHVLYPALLAVMGVLRGKRPRQAEIEPLVSLLISAYNEERVIAAKLDNSLALDYPRDRLEIVVASESTDATNAIVSAYANRGIRLLAYAGRKGKGPTLFASVPQTCGEIIVFSDANGFYEPDAIRKLVRNFADPRIGCVSGRLVYRRADHRAGASESAYWRSEVSKKLLESRLFSLLGANGSIFALRRESYRPLSERRGDDFELPTRVLLSGQGAIMDPEAISVEEPEDNDAGQFKRRIRIVAWNFASAASLAREAMRQRRWLPLLQLLTRLARWCGPVFLLTLLPASAALAVTPFYRWVLLAQLAFYAAAAAGLALRKTRGPAILRLPYSFCLNNLAMLMGVLRSARQAPTWERVR